LNPQFISKSVVLHRRPCAAPVVGGLDRFACESTPVSASVHGAQISVTVATHVRAKVQIRHKERLGRTAIAFVHTLEIHVVMYVSHITERVPMGRGCRIQGGPEAIPSIVGLSAR
jgi:hypothetical protein